MSIEAMKLAADKLEIGLAYPGMRLYHDDIRAAITALRTAIAEAEKQEPFGYFQYAPHFDAWVQNRDSNEGVAFYTAPRQEPYDQPALELCEECGWRAMIPGDGCLVCARQKAKPVAWRWKEVKGEFGDWVLTEIEPPPYITESMPLYTAPRQWVGLTDEEIKEIIGPWGDTPIKGYTRKLFDQIEAKLRSKND